MPHISATSVVFSTPWFKLTERIVAEAGVQEPYYVLESPDYTSALAVTADGDAVMVRQFRPAAGEWVLELPSGTVDSNEEPAVAIAREIREETGYRVVSLQALGVLLPDVGRLGNRQHCFFALVEPDPEPLAPEHGEIGIETRLVKLPDMLMQVGQDGGCVHSLNIAVLFLALQRGLCRFADDGAMRPLAPSCEGV